MTPRRYPPVVSATGKLEVHDDSLLGGARRMACEKCGCSGRSLIDDVDAIWRHNFGGRDLVHEPAVRHVEDDLVAWSEVIEMSKWLAVARAMSSDHYVADLAR